MDFGFGTANEILLKSLESTFNLKLFESECLRFLSYMLNRSLVIHKRFVMFCIFKGIQIIPFTIEHFSSM